MAVRLDKSWIPLNDENVAKLAAHLGVYQLANDDGEILYIGMAGARSLFGLKGELKTALEEPPAGVTQFRIEVNMSYRTRRLELLQTYMHDHGELPAANTDIDANSIGRLRPG
ncbi:MAG: hypothetical protein HOK21_13310 [Rhodospirillaceae bacterium]|jgi:hypothetical protein|nr:hypothetical protein [Rhodospirillaceae bacterium]MBT4687553.1 hypothetical protein [Rhodospirillaceae bacterium]MBT5080634.1 hypothetical protein [Rhodospirillaceae bacterium]MBT5525062.1 hypothetical protein [Rhodospirillaceae bacterium]MBT5878032.1 hypothetical protein [Rhodospirillaceae bacterium]